MFLLLDDVLTAAGKGGQQRQILFLFSGPVL